MSKTQKLSKMCYHKGSGQAYSRVRGKPIYFGKRGMIAFWSSLFRPGRKLPQNKVNQPDVTVIGLFLAYLKHSESYYGKKEHAAFTVVVRRSRHLYGRDLAKNIGPLNIKAFREGHIFRRLQ